MRLFKHRYKFKLGGRYACCQDCSLKFRHYELRRDWRGLLVCKECWEPRHPQLIPKIIGRESVPSFVLPDRTTWATGVDLIKNGSFEIYTGNQDSGSTGTFEHWTVTADDGVAEPSSVSYDGSNAVKMTNLDAGGGPSITQNITVVSGGEYSLSYYVKKPSAGVDFEDGDVEWENGDVVWAGSSPELRHKIYDVTNGANITSFTDSGVSVGEYEAVTQAFTAPSGCVEVQINIRTVAGVIGWCFLDNVKVVRTA